MANARALDKRRKSIRNIRKITRTMELIATARYRKAMDRAAAATDYTRRITQIVASLAAAGTEVEHPLLQPRKKTSVARVLAISSNRGLCGGYNASVVRLASSHYHDLVEQLPIVTLDASGKRGIGAFKFRAIPVELKFTEFDDQPAFDAVRKLADRYLELFITGQIDRLDVIYTRFESLSKQTAVVETLLPLSSMEVEPDASDLRQVSDFEFIPSAESILEEIVPTSFRIRLFKCFLDAAVSEQIARMIAMKGATENAGEIIKQLSMTYNRARQTQITGEIMEIIGGVEALNK